MKTTFNLRLPKDLCNQIEFEANENNLSINQFISYVITKTLQYNSALKNIYRRFSDVENKDYKKILEKIPKRKPLKGDEL